jgi:hypothetical protein
MKTVWFKRVGWFHLPTALRGAVIALAALAFCAQVFVVIDYKSYSASDALYDVFSFFASVFLLFDWIAARTTAENQNGK